MKLRIQGRALRLRLKQGEIAGLAESGSAEDRIELGPDTALTYRIESGDVETLAVELADNTITVVVPRADVDDWTDTDRVGIEAELETRNGTLHVLLEKDFQCLHRRPKEDESDNYPHPSA